MTRTPQRPGSARPVGGSLDGWRIQRNVINALVYRELKTRVSQVKFGVLGVFIEPLGVIAVFLLIFGLFRGRAAIGIDIILFLACGVILYTMYVNIAIRSLNSMQANEALFFYRPVKPVDTVIARALVESGLYGSILLIISGFTCLLREQWLFYDFGLLVITFIALALNAFGFGVFLMAAGHRYKALHQIVPLVMRPMWFISGIFFSLSAVPQQFLTWLSWNPIAQAIELSRSAFSPDYPINPTVISLPYLLASAAFSCAIGLWVYSNNERILLTR